MPEVALNFGFILTFRLSRMTEIHSIADLELLRESVDLECKRAGGQDGKGALPHDFWETYSAMANTDGGIVLLGLQEKKGKFIPHSLPQLDRIRKDLADLANNPRKVSINLLGNHSIRELEIDGKLLLQIEIPRATRSQRPVYLNGNPLQGNTYRRFHEADQSLGDDEVKRMLAEQTTDSLDDRILPNFDIDDLHPDSLRIYRQTHATLNPSHIWSGLTDREFLKAIGAWRKSRETGDSGLTVAGLLMFGTHPVIQEIFPYYMLDFQERPEAKTERRWVDRVTLDGTWSGNLYDFYRKVYPKLVADLKVPFEIRDGVRRDDTPVHVALREALANAIVHADYREPASVLVVKRPDMFGFRNPGLMRIPPLIALRGDEHDCRNRLLHAMFRYVNVGEQAGSGIPKILSGWESQHWRMPSLREDREPNNRTVLELQMLDLFPPGVMDVLKSHFKDRFESLPQSARLALAITLSEGRLTHGRLSELCHDHASDVSKTLRELVRDEFLTLSGGGRGAVYRFTQVAATAPEEVFGSESSTISGSSSTISRPSSTISEGREFQKRDEMGRLISGKFHLPFVDSIGELTSEFRAHLESMAERPRTKGRMERKEFEDLIVGVCDKHFITIGSLAKILNRGERTLRQDYLSKLCKEQRLRRAFPDTPNHEKQAYTKA